MAGLSPNNGSIYNLIDYNSYGTERISWNADGETQSQKTYIGEYSDKESGLSYLNARYYNPETGQFLSQDPWEGDYSDPQSLNKYAYSRNNPIKYIDPSGLFNIESGEIEYGDTLSNIAGAMNNSYGTNLSVDQIAQANGISNPNKITAGSFLALPDQSNMELRFDNNTLGDYDSVYGIPYNGLSWDGVSGKEGHAPIYEGTWTADAASTEYFDELSWIQKGASIIGLGLWPGGKKSWGSARTELDNIDTGEKNTGYYIHGGFEPGSRGCIDLTSQTDSFHNWFTNDWGKQINIKVNY